MADLSYVQEAKPKAGSAEPAKKKEPEKKKEVKEEDDDGMPKEPKPVDPLAALPKGGNWRHVEYESGFHMLLRDLQAENVMKDIVAWIND